MVEIMTAQEARAVSGSIENEKCKTQLRNIAAAISSAAARGYNSASVSLYASSPVEAKLRELGYTVKKWDDQRDGAYTQVSW